MKYKNYFNFILILFKYLTEPKYPDVYFVCVCMCYENPVISLKLSYGC